MRYATIAVWLAASGLVAVPTWSDEKAVDGQAAAKGEITFSRYCVSCHGPTGKADGPLAKELRVAVPDLTTLAARKGGAFSYDRVVRIVKSGENVRAHGTADMPAWGDAFKKTKGTEEDTVEAAVRNLAHYVWSIQQPAK